MEITPPPVAANILVGFSSFGSSTLVTIPAGRTWVGEVYIAATLLVAAAGAATQAVAWILTGGTGVIPSITADQLELVLQAPAAQATGGTAANGTLRMPLAVVAPVGNSVTITTGAFQVTAARFGAIGSLV